jgi:transcriptional regulator with XRE-family HTH domain
MRVHLLIAIRRRGLTQREFAHRHGFSEPRLSSLIRGWADAREDERERLEQALGMPASRLLRKVEAA